MLQAQQFVSLVEQLGIDHLVWVPDTTFGQWEAALESSERVRLLRVCREGEAWPLAAGLILGGSNPLVVMQSTGFFESGDALRNVVYDLQVPVFALIGARNWLIENALDSARRFIRPLLDAWELDPVWIESPDQIGRFAEHYAACRREQKPGFVVLAEGAG